MSQVETDMNAHTLTVGFDDETTSLTVIVEALAHAGYTVPEHEEIVTQ